VMAKGFNDSVLLGCDVTAQGTPDMTLAVAAGAVVTAGVLKGVTAGNVTIGAAHATLPRVDIVAVDSTGAKVVRAGTASKLPQPPTITTDDVCLAFVFVAPTDTTMGPAQILDTRVFRTTGPMIVGRLSAAIARNTSSAMETFLTVVVPQNLFVTGRQFRVNCGGTMLLNSGAPTVTLQIAFGGTTMFQDVTTAATADVDRLAWNLEFKLVAQGNTDQALNGRMSVGPVAAKTAANTGIGEMLLPAALASSQVTTPLNGAAAVNVTTADRNLTVGFQMSVSNAADEIVMEQATIELI